MTAGGKLSDFPDLPASADLPSYPFRTARAVPPVWVFTLDKGGPTKKAATDRGLL